MSEWKPMQPVDRFYRWFLRRLRPTLRGCAHCGPGRVVHRVQDDPLAYRCPDCGWTLTLHF
jgi:hypothetical protein